METFDRCPRCRQTLTGFSVYHCPSCKTQFCAGCDQEERALAGAGWLVAAALELKLTDCPVCTGAVNEDNQVGIIVGAIG